jgi:hypothetical protein
MRRSLVACALSFGLGGFLLFYLLAQARFDVHATRLLVQAISPFSLIEVTLLFALYNLIGAEKWRLIDRNLQAAGSRAMSRPLYFAFTAIGTGLGQIMPVQASLLLSRSIGAHLHGGRGLVRGGSAVALDQLFDILVAAGLGLSSTVILTAGGGAVAWTVIAAGMAVVVGALYGRLVAWLARGAAALSQRVGGRMGGWCAAVAVSPVLTPGIGRRLLVFSAARFLVLVLIGAASAQATGAEVAAWQLAVSIPFAIFANALAITPGGLGVNEWTMCTVLVSLGVSFQTAAQWALVNRLLVAAAAVLCGVAGAAVAILLRREMRGHPAAIGHASAPLTQVGDLGGN